MFMKQLMRTFAPSIRGTNHLPLMTINIMTKEKVERINKIYNWVRIIIVALFMALLYTGLAHGQSLEERVDALANKLQTQQEKSQYMPQLPHKKFYAVTI